MSGTISRPDWASAISDLTRRIGVLERRVPTGPPAVDSSQEIIFSYTGTVAASTSPPVRVWRGGNLSVVAVTFATAGSTSTVLTVNKNGTAVGTVTVPASTTLYNGDVSARFIADVDVLTLTVTTAGTGAADMTATARFT